MLSLSSNESSGNGTRAFKLPRNLDLPIYRCVEFTSSARALETSASNVFVLDLVHVTPRSRSLKEIPLPWAAIANSSCFVLEFVRAESAPAVYPSNSTFIRPIEASEVSGWTGHVESPVDGRAGIV